MCVRWNACYATAPERRISNPVTHYVVARADLPRGLQAAQIVHAAGESGGEKCWGAHAVVLVVQDECALRALSLRLTEAGVAHVRIVESDAPYAGQVTALGLHPARKEDLRRHLSALPLLK